MASHLLIFEGAELAGKSYLISEVYRILEERYQTSRHRLDGCHWFNCDVGIFGGPYGRVCIEKSLEMAEAMPNRHIIFEKFHVSDAVYHQLYESRKIDYNDIEARLQRLGARLIFCAYRPDGALIKQRLADRLKLYPHYRRIAQTPAAYLEQQELYRAYVQSSSLPSLTVDTTQLPNPAVVKKIITWIR